MGEQPDLEPLATGAARGLSARGRRGARGRKGDRGELLRGRRCEPLRRPFVDARRGSAVRNRLCSRAEPPDRVFGVPRGGVLAKLGTEAVTDEIVPAFVRALVPALEARNDQPLRRARHRDIEQPPMLARRRVLRGLPRRSPWAAVVALFRRPDEQRRVAPATAREVEPCGIVPAAGRRTGIGQEHDRRLQPLCGVHRHHAHAAGLDLHVALDRDVARLDLGEEGGQRGRIPPLESERDAP